MNREYSVKECKQMEAWMSVSQSFCTAAIMILILCAVCMTGLLTRNEMNNTQIKMIFCIGFALILTGVKTLFRHIQIIFARKRILLDNGWF